MVCQALLQTRVPDFIAIHQNGGADDYRWAVQDLLDPARYSYIYTKGSVLQPNYQLPAIKSLLLNGCDLFTKWDQDDIYYADHLEKLEDLLKSTQADAAVCLYGDVLEMVSNKPELVKSLTWPWNPCMGPSTGVLMTRPVMEDVYLRSIEANPGTPDDIPMGKALNSGKHKVVYGHESTLCYVVHGGNISGDLTINPDYIKQKKDR